jgi:3-methyladenine DNA glycosylase AlkD
LKRNSVHGKGSIIPYLRPLQEAFEQLADTANANAMQAYMKGLFPFYGIKAELRRLIVADFLKENAMPDPFDREVLLSMWNILQREFHYYALDIMRKQVYLIKKTI